MLVQEIADDEEVVVRVVKVADIVKRRSSGTGRYERGRRKEKDERKYKKKKNKYTHAGAFCGGGIQSR